MNTRLSDRSGSRAEIQVERPLLDSAEGSNGSGPGVELRAPMGCCIFLTEHSNVEIGGPHRPWAVVRRRLVA